MKNRIIFRLPPEMDQAARQLVKSGQYKSLSELARDALSRLLKESAE